MTRGRNPFIEFEASANGGSDDESSLFSEHQSDRDFIADSDDMDIQVSAAQQLEEAFRTSSNDSVEVLDKPSVSTVQSDRRALPIHWTSASYSEKRKRKKKTPTIESDPPGTARHPVSDWSLTVTRTNDVAVEAVDGVYKFYAKYCIKGIASLEVGKRARHLHVQGVFRTKYPTTGTSQKQLPKYIRPYLPCSGVGYRIALKPLVNKQQFLTMCGYCLKDEGQSWFQTRIFNIPRNELEQGRLQHIAQLTSFDENKTVLTQRNLFAEIYKFSRRSLYPVVPPLRYTLLYAVQSGEYVPSPEWVRKYAKMEHNDAEALWKIIHDPKSASIEQTDTVFFDSRSISGAVPDRYFLVPCGSISSSSSATTAGTLLRTPQVALAPAYKRIIALLRQRHWTPARRAPSFLSDSFIPLPAGQSPNVCADTLEEILFTVRNVRAGRTDVLDNVTLSPRTLASVTGDATDEEPDLSPETPLTSQNIPRSRVFPSVTLDFSD